MFGIEEVFLWSDNVGCYYCGCLWLSMYGISERIGEILIVWNDFFLLLYLGIKGNYDIFCCFILNKYWFMIVL